MSSSKSKGEGDDSPSVNIEKKQHLPTYLVQGLLSLMRIRDFLSLILTYPMRIGNEEYMEEWLNEVAEFSADYSKKLLLLNTAHVDWFSYGMICDLWSDVDGMLSRRPLRHVGWLIPEYIIREIENGGSFSFSESKSKEPNTATSSSNKEKQLEQVPQPVLDLATRLAVEQLLQTLTSENKSSGFVSSTFNIAENIMFSTRNDAEKQTALEKIKEALQIHTPFQRVIVFDVSKDEICNEFEVLSLEVRRWLGQIMGKNLQTKDDKVLLARKSERNKMKMRKGNRQSLRQLVILMDGFGEKKIDLQKVGFPKKREMTDVVVLITTESSVKQNIELITDVDLLIKTGDHVLPWEVFCNNVGRELVYSSMAIQRIAGQMVEECSGHLLAIVLVAKSLKNVTDVQLWKVALEKLCSPSLFYKINKFDCEKKAITNAFINFIGIDVKPHLRQCLGVFKSTLLIMKEHRLFKKWIERKLVNSQEKAEHTLRELVQCSVLFQLEGTKHNDILFPKDIRDILVALQDNNSYENLKKEGLGLTEPPKVWDWHSALQIELIHNNISKLPQSPNCPTLEVLLLHSSANLTKLPILFFEHMPLLQVLDLSYTGIQGLPSSIFKLAQLKSLYLTGCEQFKQLPPEIEQLKNLEKLDLDGTPITHLPQSLNFPKLISLSLGGNLDLMKLPSSFFDHMPLLSILHLSSTSLHDLPSSFFNLGELKEFYLKNCELFMELPPEIRQLRNLKKLDLDGTRITHLPKDIQELTNLESLSLSFSEYHHNGGHGEKCMLHSSFTMIPLGFISKLTHLECLRIEVNPESKWWQKNVEQILAEIVRLKRLQILDLYIPEVKLLKLTSRYVSSFRFIVGHHMQRIISYSPPEVDVNFKQSDRSLRFINGVDFPDDLKDILPFVQAFFLDCHMTVNDLSQFGLKNLQFLRLCILAECNEMHYIVNSDYSCLKEFLYLEFLTIYHMKNLKSIFGCCSSLCTFSRLKFLALHTCPELTTIFTTNDSYDLSNLEELIVEDCPKVTNIISYKTWRPKTSIFFPRLKKMSLLYLPKLVSISDKVYIGKNLEKIGFYYCPKLESLSFAKLSSKELKVIRGEMKWWEALKWSEAEWGQEGRPNNFNHIFSPIDEGLDVLTQLSA